MTENTTEIPTETETRRMGRGLRLLLVVSLGLNLLVLGVVGGAVFGEWREPHRPIVRDLGFGPYAEALTHADRVALIRAFAKETGGFRAERQAARQTFGDLLGVLRTDPFDAGRMKVLMTQQEQRMSQRLALGQKLLIGRIEAMTPDERHAFADRLQEALAHRPRDRHHPPRPPRPEGAAPQPGPAQAPATAPAQGSGN